MQHGYVIQIGNQVPQYYTGCGYSVSLNDAKVFRTSRGAMIASSYWQTSDYGTTLPPQWYMTRKPVAVSLTLTQGQLL